MQSVVQGEIRVDNSVHKSETRKDEQRRREGRFCSGVQWEAKGLLDVEQEVPCQGQD